MENIVFLLLALGLIAIGTTIVLIRAREPRGEFAVKSFHKEMKALAPDGRSSTPAEGTQIRTRGRLNRVTPTRCSKRRIMRSVMSKSVMAPPRSGRTATM